MRSLGDSSTGHPYDLSLRLWRDQPSTHFLRHLARETLGYLGIPDEPLRDIELAVTEACAHVLDHPSRADSILVHTKVWPTHCELSVSDDGTAIVHDPPLGNGGHNRRQASVRLDLMDALVDDVDIRPTDVGGIRVVLVKELR